MVNRIDNSSAFEKNLSAEVGFFIEAVESNGNTGKDVDLTQADEDNQLRFMLIKDQAASTLSNLFKAKFPKKIDLQGKFSEEAGKVLNRRAYKILLSAAYNAAVAKDEAGVSTYLEKLYEKLEAEFFIVHEEEIPPELSSARGGTRMKLDAATLNQLGAGNKWAGSRLEESTERPTPMWHREGGGHSRREAGFDS